MESSTDCANDQICLEQDESAIRSLYERRQKAPDHRKRRGKRYEAAVVLTCWCWGSKESGIEVDLQPRLTADAPSLR